MLGAADVRGVLPQHRDGTQGDLRYGDVLDGADLVYDVQPAQVKETMVLDEAPKTTTEYRWLLSAPGLSVQPDSVGGFVVLRRGRRCPLHHPGTRDVGLAAASSASASPSPLRSLRGSSARVTIGC